jgi:sulfate-transporting ATPase
MKMALTSRIACAALRFSQIGDRELHIRAYLASFNILGELQTKLVSALSGGERNRVHLARTLRMPCNLLLLDEPTNDLGNPSFVSP